MPKCRKVPTGEQPLEPVEVSCNESSLDTHSVFEASQLSDEDAPEYTGRVGEKRLAQQPSEELKQGLGPKPVVPQHFVAGAYSLEQSEAPVKRAWERAQERKKE